MLLRRVVIAVVAISLIALPGCRTAPAPWAASPGAQIFDGLAVRRTTGVDGTAVIASAPLKVEYEITVMDGSGSPLQGIDVHYGENDRGMSFIYVVDPSHNLAPVIIGGTPSFIAGLPFASVSSAATGSLVGEPIHGEGLFVGAVLIGIFLYTAAKWQIDYAFNTFENKVFLQTDRLALTEDYLEYCKTAPEIAGYYVNQAESKLILGQIATAYFMFGVTAWAGTGKLLSFGFDAMELIGIGPFALANNIIESMGLAFPGQFVDASTPLRVRLYNWQNLTRENVIFAPLHFVGVGCDPATDDVSAIGSVTLDVVPASPSAFEGVTITAQLSPPTQGLEVLFEAIGTDGYRKSEKATSGGSGQAVFFVPGGASGVVDDYFVLVPAFGASKRSMITFGASSGP